MKKLMKKLFSCLMCACMVFGMAITAVSAAEEVTVTGTQKAYIIGDDWGPAVSKTIMTLDETIAADSVDAEDFTVVEEKLQTNWTTYQVEVGSSTRKVTDAYTSDAEGNEVDTDSNYVTIEMYVSPDEGSPFIYYLSTGYNDWCDPYNLYVSLNEGATLTTADGDTVVALDVDESIDVAGDGKICPQTEDFNMSTYTTNDGTEYSYAEYVPETDNHTNALVIWLHGAGEGGNDPYIDLLGNEVTALVSDEFQDLFDGAYILTPQCPTFWMDDGNGSYQNGDLGSCYTESLMEFIKAYVAANPDIDPNRVIIGGCSNGGYMTMEMILADPDYFAAAFPICEAFMDEYITDEQIESIKDMPLWFIYAENDTTVDPTTHEIPTIERLIAASASNLHVSVFEDVHDTTGRFDDEDGNAYQYSGHWSWVYFDNNECYEGDLNCWEWLAQQSKVEQYVVEGTQKAYIIGDDWGPAVTKTVIALDETITADSVDAEYFKVIEEKNQTTNWATGEVGLVTSTRTILDAYTSDAEGNEVDSDSNYVTIEMYVSPSEGSPFIYYLTTGFNKWCDPYNLYVSLVANATLTTTNGDVVTALDVEESIDVAGDGKICPQGDDFDMSSYTTSDGTTYSYAQYVPEEDDQTNALIIWLHGAGEGGDDPYIDILGNEVTALVSDEFQDLFDGAYVLVPQCPTFWMDDGTGSYQNGDLGSCYTESLMEFIMAYVEANPDIDPDRIIIGGCSNGGYMTMEMILTYPDYFAAAFPICEAFMDEYITDEQIESIKDMPLWFIYAENDTTVDPTTHEIPTIERLIAAGASNLHVSVFADVHDTTGRFDDEDGNAYQYSGHWSWVYFDNNECYDENGINCWEWLAQQTKATSDASTGDDPTGAGTGSDTTGTGTTGTGTTGTSTGTVKTGDNTNAAIFAACLVAAGAGYIVIKRRKEENE